jgi:hypothetical protein
MALKFLRMLLYRGSCDCTRPTSSVARDMRLYLPLRRASQRYDQRTHINRSRGRSMWAECQVSPPSTLTSIWSMAPAPEMWAEDAQYLIPAGWTKLAEWTTDEDAGAERSEPQPVQTVPQPGSME